ncbi:TERF1-interacting nuclear factor 2 [Haliaeetus albicilla]|uniref:TERF1-interacting nuclear factor 2 n=1 Tax=Haliaeetus albicilla TaxID=8969 RepID=UPI0037E86C29
MGGSDVSPGVSLRVALAGAWHVVRGRSLGQFPRVLGLLEAVGRAAPAAVRFRHGARLRLGLQAAVVVQMLQEAQPDGKIFDAVDSFFPEGDAPPAAGHAQATPQELAMVGEAQESFRDLVLALLADRGRRAAYLQVPFPSCSPVPPSCSPVPPSSSPCLPVPPSIPRARRGRSTGSRSCRRSSTFSTSTCSAWRAPCPPPTCGSSTRRCGGTPLPDSAPLTCQS